MKESYIVWSDGVLTSMGILCKKLDDGRYEVKNPVNIVFSMEQKPVEGKPGEFTGVLRFDLTPYIFGACLNAGSSGKWIVKPLHVLEPEGNTLNEQLIAAYQHTVDVTETPKKK